MRPPEHGSGAHPARLCGGGKCPGAELSRLFSTICLWLQPSISFSTSDLCTIFTSGRFGGLALLEGTCSPTERGAKMTNPAPWNPQTPVARSAFPHPARLGKRNGGSGSRRIPAPAGAAIAASTHCPGGHATCRGASTARSTGAPHAFAERPQGHDPARQAWPETLKGSWQSRKDQIIWSFPPIPRSSLSPVGCMVYLHPCHSCRFGALALPEATSPPKKGGAKMPNPSPQKRPAPAGQEPF